jgi:hypothetical protein
MNKELVQEYKTKIEPILPLAKKAFGSRSQTTPAHNASREYTRLLIEFSKRGGSLPQLAKELKVAYAGVRRRVVMDDVTVSSIKPKIRASKEDVERSARRVEKAKEKSVDDYHDQLAKEYQAGISLSNLAKALGLSSAAPLYYGVQRSIQRAK